MPRENQEKKERVELTKLFNRNTLILSLLNIKVDNKIIYKITALFTHCKLLHYFILSLINIHYCSLFYVFSYFIDVSLYYCSLLFIITIYFIFQVILFNILLYYCSLLFIHCNLVYYFKLFYFLFFLH